MNKEVQTYKIELFGKDVLSIIELYNPEGWDQWSQLIEKLNMEYHKVVYWDDNQVGILSKFQYNLLWNYRQRLFNNYRSIYYIDISTGIATNMNILVPLHIRH